MSIHACVSTCAVHNIDRYVHRYRMTGVVKRGMQIHRQIGCGVCGVSGGGGGPTLRWWVVVVYLLLPAAVPRAASPNIASNVPSVTGGSFTHTPLATHQLGISFFRDPTSWRRAPDTHAFSITLSLFPSLLFIQA